MIATPKPEVGSRERSRIVAVYCLLAALPLLGSLFSVAGRGLAGVDWQSSRSGLLDEESLAAVGVHTIDSVKGWNHTVMRGQRILFVDCDWNTEVVAFRQTAADYAALVGNGVDAPIVRVHIDANARESALFICVQQLWRDNKIYPGSMKNLGGAGRVVWLVHGKVVDYAWGHEISGLNDFKQRTALAFQNVASDNP